MSRLMNRRAAGVIAAVAVAGVISAGCSTDETPTPTTSDTISAPAETSPYTPAPGSASAAAPATVTLKGVQGRSVVLTGPIAAKYSAASAAQKKALGKPLDGDRNAGTRDSGVVFQQFKGGAIVAKNAQAGTPAYIVWGKIRDAWNIERAPDGTPAIDGKNGSAGPLGVPTSDEMTDGDVKSTTFEHGSITYNTKTGKVTVRVNGKVVPAE